MDSAKIWVHEINNAILNMLRNSLTYKTGEVIKPVTVRYSKPEGETGEGVSEELPIVTFKLNDLLLDLERIGTTQWLKRRMNETDDTVDLVSYPIPYWLYYTFSVTSEFREDSLDIMTQLQGILPARGYIMVPDSITNEDVPLFIQMIKFEDAERVHGEKTLKEESLRRRFRTMIRYKLTAELDRNDAETFFKVKDMEVEVNEEVDE